MPPEDGLGARGRPGGAPTASRAIARPVTLRLVCHGCGYRAPLEETRPYRCRGTERKDNVDHVLRRVFDASTFESQFDPSAVFGSGEPNPFRKFRRLSYSYQIARLGGMPDSEYLRTVDRLDAAVTAVEGRGFRSTPFETEPQLARAVGIDTDRLWVKDETGNVAGSHKARHLMGIMLWLETIRALRRPRGTDPVLAIASCGNAALAAAVLARAACRPIEIFVPPDANASIARRLLELGAELTRCPRQASDPFGDPCYLRFLEAWRKGALPFTVQGPSNGLAIEGGCTLAWEMVGAWGESRVEPDHLVIQVGGGALATSCIEGLRNARDLGLIERLPRIHTVQTASGYPLRRAYDRLTSRLSGVAPPDPPEVGHPKAVETADARALSLRDEVDPETLAKEVDHAARHRADFMWAWETEPKSIAYGILDDETYDWLAVIEGMLATGGIPLVVSEDRLREAHTLARTHTAIPVEPTGTAGLAGLIDLHRAGVVRPGETVALLFTGVER